MVPSTPIHKLLKVALSALYPNIYPSNLVKFKLIACISLTSLRRTIIIMSINIWSNYIVGLVWNTYLTEYSFNFELTTAILNAFTTLLIDLRNKICSVPILKKLLPKYGIDMSRSMFSRYFFINGLILVQSLIAIPSLAEVSNTLLLSHEALPTLSCTKKFVTL